MNIKIEDSRLRVTHKSEEGFLKTVSTPTKTFQYVTESFLENWKEALISGNYKQGRNSLCKSDNGISYCCLGVIAKEYNYTNDIIHGVGFLSTLRNSLVRLPNSIRKNKEFNEFFSKLNDDLNLSFTQIATVITFIIVRRLCTQK